MHLCRALVGDAASSGAEARDDTEAVEISGRGSGDVLAARGRRLLSRGPFEAFPASVRERSLPIVLFNDDGREQLVWHDGRLVDGQVECPHTEPDVWNRDAVSMSPAYLGFAIEPYESRYLQYKGVGIAFARPCHGSFMQPSIDTILVCVGLDRIFAAGNLLFSRIIDVGTGSGFIGKFAAVKAPGDGRLSATLVDVDPAAADYCRTPAFGARPHGVGGREVAWRHVTGDAAQLLGEDARFDLVVSNPPYIPTKGEVEDDDLAQPSGFWEGCGLLVRLMELMLGGKFLPDAHLVVMVTSLTLKSQRVASLLDQAPAAGVRVRQLLEREIAWKAWYAGRGRKSSYLSASTDERTRRRRFGDCEYFVGCTPPGESRSGGGRDKLRGYHWHVAYVLDIWRERCTA